MSYTAEISRTNPTCFVFLIDQSSSMAEPFDSQPEKSKADGVADAINRLLQNLALKSAKSDGIRDYFYIGVIGYGGKAASSWGGKLADQGLVPVSLLASNPLRIEQRTRKVDDGAGGLIDQAFKFPIWFEAKAGGRTPMCQALALAKEWVEGFIKRFPASYPPMVLNITDGKPTDGDPRPLAEAIKKLTTQDGNVLLFNAHISESSPLPIMFPISEAGLPDDDSKLLFAMSSSLPPKLQATAISEGYPGQGTMRGFAFNADLVAIIRFIDIGTRVSPAAR